jgi:DNA-binding HxlR family transcriptional regulator
METMLVEPGGTALPAFTQDCPSRTVLDVIASKWTLYVLGLLHLSGRPLRFTELRRHIGGGVSQKSLTQTLRNLERDGLVTRTVYPTVPPRVDYALTELGKQAERLTTAIATWSVENAPLMLAARDAFDHRPDPAEQTDPSITSATATSADA